MQTDTERKESKVRAAAKYNASSKGKECKARYEQTEAGKAVRDAAYTDYAQTDKGKARSKRASTKYAAAHPERKAAHQAVRYALHDGTLLQLPCQVCGCIHVEAHHSDYDKPLDVIWLCREHHLEEHNS